MQDPPPQYRPPSSAPKRHSPEIAKNVQINTIICVVSPLAAGLVSMLLIFGEFVASGYAEAGTLVIWFFMGAVPAATGYSISLVWRRMHPGVYFVIGLGMSIAAACVFLGIFFAICFALFAGY